MKNIQLFIFTFTSYSGKIFKSFSTYIAEFTLKPGYIRPYVTHGILKILIRTSDKKKKDVTLISIGAMLEHGDMTCFRQRS